MNTHETTLGGGSGTGGGAYGTLTLTGTLAILRQWTQHTEFGRTSTVLDIGSGLCRFLMHAICAGNPLASFGIEYDVSKCMKAQGEIDLTMKSIRSSRPADVSTYLPTLPVIIHGIISPGNRMINSIEPATHIYAAWQGFHQDDVRVVGELFKQSRTARVITIVQNHKWISSRSPVSAKEQMETFMGERGFGPVVMLGEAMSVHLSGSNSQLQAYTFLKLGEATLRPGTDSRAGLAALPAFCSKNIPKRSREISGAIIHSACKYR